MKHLTKEEFNTKIKESGKNLFYFSANWCNPCKVLQPMIETLQTDLTSFEVYKIDIEQEPDLVKEYSIKSIPTILFVNDGILKETTIGLQSKEKIISILNKI